MKNLLDFSGRCVLVVGGSSGIGNGMAHRTVRHIAQGRKIAQVKITETGDRISPTARSAPPCPQPCLTGVDTTRPSIASVRMIWQDNRELPRTSKA